MREHHEELAVAIAVDQAKHISEARGEVQRVIEIVETACVQDFYKNPSLFLSFLTPFRIISSVVLNLPEIVAKSMPSDARNDRNR